jgi:hypothetical protein
MKKTFFLVALLCASVAQAAEPTVAATDPTWPAAQVVSIYSEAYTSVGMSFGEWGSGSASSDFVIGENHSTKVVVGTIGVGYFGLQFGAAQNVLNMEKVHVDIYVEEALEPNFYLISQPSGEKGKKLSLTADTWNAVDIDLADFSPVGMSDIHQIKFDGIVGKTLYLDNIYFYRTTPNTDEEAPTEVSASVKSVSYVSAVLTVSAKDNSGAVSFDVFDGENKVATGGGESEASIDITVNNLAANTTYNLSVVAYDGNENKAVAVPVEVKTLALPAAAPAPTAKAENVLSLYSDAYTPATGFNVGWWSQTTVATEAELATDEKAYLCTSSNYLGWELAGAIDASEYKAIHMDVYPLDGTSIEFTPISAGPAEKLVKKEGLTVGQWNALEFELTEFTGVNMAAIIQVKWASMPATMLLDNVYFFKDEATAIDEVESQKVESKKIIEDGKLVIIKNGVRYDATGQVIR